MKFVSYATASRSSYGLLSEEGDLLDLPAAAKHAGGTLPERLAGFIAAGVPALELARQLAAGDWAPFRKAAHDVKLLAPIPRPAKNVFCVGRNFRDHVAEGYRAAGRETKLPEFPQFFTKPPTAVVGPDESFPLDPAVTRALDYEVELALVIGSAGRNIPREAALSHVFGVTVLNDITGRDLQRRHDQWFKGKGLDRSCPMGPCIVTLDAIPDLAALELTTRVNGEERQRGTIAQLIFDIPEIIAQLSLGMTLEPGDIIATGTPSGVGYAMQPPRLLGPGDVVECAIGGIGALVTRIVAA
jgi:2-keto-4-pentenoate hydratase/2-oxohepta-3-ene-1,7-dioic acid hydratase in catechol pathway